MLSDSGADIQSLRILVSQKSLHYLRSKQRNNDFLLVKESLKHEKCFNPFGCIVFSIIIIINKYDNLYGAIMLKILYKVWPLLLHYYSEVLPTTALILCRNLYSVSTKYFAKLNTTSNLMLLLVRI